MIGEVFDTEIKIWNEEQQEKGEKVVMLYNYYITHPHPQTAGHLQDIEDSLGEYQLEDHHK